VPILAQRQHGVGQVIAASDAVEHRRDVPRVLVEGGATHAVDATVREWGRE
jgi:hypothetical protein